MTIQLWSSHRVELSIYKEKPLQSNNYSSMDSFCFVDSFTRPRNNGSSKRGSNEPIRQSGQSGCLSNAEHRLVGHWHLLNGLVFRLRSDEHEVHAWLEKGASHCTVRPFVHFNYVLDFFFVSFSVASIFLGYGGLFLLLWVGIFVWMAMEEWGIFRAMFVFFVDLDVIRVDFLLLVVFWGLLMIVFIRKEKQSQDELLSSFLDSLINSSFSMFLIPQFVHIQSTGKIRCHTEMGSVPCRNGNLRWRAAADCTATKEEQHRDTFVSMLTEWMSIEREGETWITHCKRDWHGKERRMGRKRERKCVITSLSPSLSRALVRVQKEWANCAWPIDPRTSTCLSAVNLLPSRQLELIPWLTFSFCSDRTQQDCLWHTRPWHRVRTSRFSTFN